MNPRENTDNHQEKQQMVIMKKTSVAITAAVALAAVCVAVPCVWEAVCCCHKVREVVQAWQVGGPHTTRLGMLHRNLAAAWWLGSLRPDPPRDPVQECGIPTGESWREVVQLLARSKQYLECLEHSVRKAHEEHQAFTETLHKTPWCLGVLTAALLAACCVPRATWRRNTANQAPGCPQDEGMIRKGNRDRVERDLKKDDDDEMEVTSFAVLENETEKAEDERVSRTVAENEEKMAKDTNCTAVIENKEENKAEDINCTAVVENEEENKAEDISCTAVVENEEEKIAEHGVCNAVIKDQEGSTCEGSKAAKVTQRRERKTEKKVNVETVTTAATTQSEATIAETSVKQTADEASLSECNAPKTRESCHSTRQKGKDLPPWCPLPGSYEETLSGLHQEVTHFCKWVSGSDAERARRMGLVEGVRRVVSSLCPTFRTHVTGSLATGLFLPDSDVDLTVLGQWHAPPMQQLRDSLVQQGQAAPETAVVLDRASVPIVKFIHPATGLHVDISFGNAAAVMAVDLVQSFLRCFPALRPLALTVRYFLRQRGLAEVYTGGVSSYAVTLMAVSLLQLQAYPCFQRHLGRMVLLFFNFYGHRFQYDEAAISVREGGRYLWREMAAAMPDRYQMSPLVIEDPLTPGNNVARASFRAGEVRAAFQQAYSVLAPAQHSATSSSGRRAGRSLLGQLLLAPGTEKW